MPMTLSEFDPEFDPEVVYHLRSAIGRLGRYLRLTHADGRLTPSQREVLGLLVRRGPRRLSLLAAEEGLNLTMASRIVSTLTEWLPTRRWSRSASISELATW